MCHILVVFLSFFCCTSNEGGGEEDVYGCHITKEMLAQQGGVGNPPNNVPPYIIRSPNWSPPSREGGNIIMHFFLPLFTGLVSLEMGGGGLPFDLKFHIKFEATPVIGEITKTNTTQSTPPITVPQYSALESPLLFNQLLPSFTPLPPGEGGGHPGVEGGGVQTRGRGRHHGCVL